MQIDLIFVFSNESVYQISYLEFYWVPNQSINDTFFFFIKNGFQILHLNDILLVSL
jgi:hypothetical protein